MTYMINQQWSGSYEVIDTDDGEQCARVSLFMPGPMVSVTGPSVTSPDLARAIAEAMLRCARDVEAERTARVL